jgi:hypothetical protein
VDKVERVNAISELFDLINVYYVERDQPFEMNFFEEVERYCVLLELDFGEFKKVFKLDF